MMSLFFARKFRSSVLVLLLVLSTISRASSNVASSQSVMSANIIKVGNSYTVFGTVDLKGQTFRIPKNYELDCRNGVLKNGTVIGNQNKIIYESPFIGDSLIIEGCYIGDKIVCSENVLVKNKFSNYDIHNVYNIAKNGATILFERGIYKDVSYINISKSVTIDFSNSIIETAIDEYELSCSVFLTDVTPQKCIESVIIKNLTIDGKRPRYGLESGIGPRRNAIRLINVDNITLENVAINHFRFGTSGFYDKDVKKCYMAGVCAIMQYTNCTIQNCSLSKCTGEGFYLVPKGERRNFTLFKGNCSKQNYGTFLTLVDGRCLVEDNEMDVFGLSGFNLFCYNSIIRNNSFKGGERFNCIDITENGLYWPKNVEISGNVADNCDGFIMVSGENITVSNNICRNPLSGFALTVFGYSEPQSNSYFLTQRGRVGGSATIKIENNDWQCKGGIVTYKGCKGVLDVVGNIIAIEPDDIGKPHRGTTMELYDCRKVNIEGNTFNNSFRNSITRSNVYITMKGCCGDATIKNNTFERTVSTSDKTSYFLFSEDTSLDHLTIENNISNVDGITFRAAEGRISVRSKSVVRNNGDIVIRSESLE